MQKPRFNPVLAVGQAPRSDSPGRFTTLNTVPQNVSGYLDTKRGVFKPFTHQHEGSSLDVTT